MLLKKKKEVEWNSECQEAFLKLKALCFDTPVPAYADYTNPFKTHTDALEVWGLCCIRCRKMVLRE